MNATDMCKALSSGVRNRVLQVVIDSKGELGVNDIARQIGVKSPHASLALHQLAKVGAVNAQLLSDPVRHRWIANPDFFKELEDWAAGMREATTQTGIKL